MMTIYDRPYIMGFEDALKYGVDCYWYEEVNKLPAGKSLMAIAGVWGAHSNIRCLFEDDEGYGYLRNISGRGGRYIIRELGLDAKEIEAGALFELNG